MNNKNNILSIIIILLLCIIIGLLFFSIKRPKDNLDSDSDAVPFVGNQDLPEATTEERTIAIPGIESLVFTAGTKDQKVNFYNPKENDCMIQLILYVNEVALWESGNIEPGKGYYNINLVKPLKKGTYDGKLLYKCFRQDGTPLNNANVQFDILVQ